MYGIFDSTWQHERERLEALCALFDSSTIRYIQGLGIKEGWVCAELGAGTGSIAAMLCQTVGADGIVDAFDIDARFLRDIPSKTDNLKIVQCDVTQHPFTADAYDLIHSRMLLTHIFQPMEFLERILLSLKPGGWFLCEELDASIGGVSFPESAALAKAYAAMNSLMQQSGLDPFLGRKLPLVLRRLGLKKLGGEARAGVNLNGTPGATLLRLGLKHNHDRLIRERLISESDLEKALDCIRDTDLIWYSTMAVATWGQKSP
jgi:SAM-dependent methyltransferase